jgi:hypothetical protein
VASRIVSFNDFADRECPWFRPDYSTNNGYGCTHPSQEDVEIVAVPAIGGDFWRDGADETGPTCLVPEGRCFSFSCPLGYELYPESEPKDAELMKAHGFNPEDCSDGFWMELVIDPDEALTGAA